MLTSQQPSNNNPRSIGDAAINILTGVLTGRSSNTNNEQEKLITINPDKDLQLTLGSDLYVNRLTETQTR